MLTGLVALSTLLLAADPAARPAPSAPAKAVATPSAPPAAPRARFVSEPFAFSAAFPCEPRQQTMGDDPAAGPVKVHVFTCGGEQKGESAFGVSVLVPPAEGAAELANLEFIKAMLQGLAGQIATGTSGKVLREGPVKLGAVEGYETIVEGAGGRGRFRAFPHAGRIYQII